MPQSSTHPNLALRPTGSAQSSDDTLTSQSNNVLTPSYNAIFLDIPSEIRLRIYAQYFKPIIIFDAPSNPARVNGLPAERWHGPGRRWIPLENGTDMRTIINLLLVCKLIKIEAAPVFYQKATFGFVGCDMLTALAHQTILFLNLPTALFHGPYGIGDPMRLVSSVTLDLTHSSSEEGQWADQLPHDTAVSILKDLTKRTSKLRRLEIAIDGDRYDVFDSVYLLSGRIYHHLCGLRHLNYFRIKGRDDQTREMELMFKALTWVLNRHILSEHQGVDTSGYDLNPNAMTRNDGRLQALVGQEMLRYPELAADAELSATIASELADLAP